MRLQDQTLELVDVGALKPHPSNPRRGDLAAITASIEANGFYGAVVAQRSTGYILAGNHRHAAATSAGARQIPCFWLECDDATAARILAADNRTSDLGGYDEVALAELLTRIQAESGGLEGTGYDQKVFDQIIKAAGDAVLGDGDPDEQPVDIRKDPVAQLGDLWLCGPHRVLCGDCTDAANVARLLGDRKPVLMVTDPPYGISLDSEWRDRAGLNTHPGQHRTKAMKDRAKNNPSAPAEPSYMRKHLFKEGHTETTVSGDTRVDWSDAFELVPSLQVAYVWHASVGTRAVLDGLERIGFLYPQQIIWDKCRVVLTRTHYWYQHEHCWYVRKKNAPWFGKAGENSTVWDAPSPKFIMGSSDEEKHDHPTQSPIELMRKPILNHTKRGELVFEPFLGSGTTLAAAENTGRVCCGIEIEPKYVDVVVQRWQNMAGAQATLDGDGRTWAQIRDDGRTPAPTKKAASRKAGGK